MSVTLFFIYSLPPLLSPVCLQHTEFWPLRESDGPRLQPIVPPGWVSPLTHIPELPRAQELLSSAGSHFEIPDWLEETWGNCQLCGLWQHSQVRQELFLCSICECLKLCLMHVVITLSFGVEMCPALSGVDVWRVGREYFVPDTALLVYMLF